MTSKLAPVLAALTLFPCATVSAATLSHRFSFDSGAELLDSVGAIDGVLNGGATVSGGALQLSGLGSGTGANRMSFSSSIDIGGNFGATGVTVESWYTDANTGTWGKLFQFGTNSAGQELGYTHTRGSGQQSGVDRDGAKLFGEQITPNVEHHIVITVASDGTLNTWVDGDQKLTNISTNAPSNITTNFEAIGATSWGDPGMRGQVDEFRIWEGTMTSAEVADSFASGPDQLPGGGPSISSFTASPASRQEGQTTTLAWDVDVANVAGALALELRGPGDVLLHSASSASGSFPVTIGDTGGAAAVWTYTLIAWDTDDPANVRSATTDLAVDPGIPIADPQSLQTMTTTPLGVTLTATDPNTHPNASLSYAVVSGPSAGSLSGTAPDLTYAANAGFTGTDSFTFQANDGKYDSPPATVAIEVVAAPAAPTDITLSTTNVGENVISGGLVAVLNSVDANAADTHTYSLVAGAGSVDNSAFSIVGSQLRAAASFAGQVGNTLTIRLRTLDSGGLSFERAFTLTVVEASIEIVINEIHYNPPDNPVRQEFVELSNPDDAPADLGGWRLSGAVDFVFAAGTLIPAGGYLLVAEDPPTMAATFNATALGPFSGNLDSRGETVRLRDANDAVIDEVDYKVGFPWPVASDGGGASIELINPALDNALGSSWRPSLPQVLLPEATLLELADNGWSWRPGDSEASTPTSAWRGDSFVEDGTWQAAQAPLGYGNVNGVTLNTMITGMRSNYSCVFVRNTFTIAPGEIPSALELNHTVDDGFIVWINGVEVARVRFDPDDTDPTIADFASGTGTEGEFGSTSVTNPGAFLVEGTNTIAVQLFNATIGSSDLGFDLQVVRPGQDGALPTPTPGGRNVAFASNAAPNIRKVAHAPDQPASTDPVVISAKVTDPNGIHAVNLEYQVVTPGNYVPAQLPLPVSGNNINTALPRPDNPDYETGWTIAVMNDGGFDGDTLAGDDIYTATLPARAHRTLVRYRITVQDGLDLAARVPYADDASLNFAYFVYDGVPAYEGTDAGAMAGTLPVYHLITRGEDYSECFAYSGGDRINQGTQARFFYNWNATFVYDGVVYDNIRYRLRGANGRYQGGGKRSMRFRFNDGYFLEARDLEGGKFSRPWRTLTFGKCQSNRSTQTFGLNEAVNFYLWDKVGVPAANAQWAHWRVIDRADEAPDRWRGDFHGFYLVSETYDVRFLEEHDLAKGNLYKLINQTSNWQQQQRYQHAFAPSNGEDHNWIEGQLDGGDSAATIEANVNVEKWYLNHAMVQATRHYDYWPSANKNMVYYFEPDYTPANGNRGKLWILPWDTDSSWGPSYNHASDVVHNAIFDGTGGGSDNNTTPELWPGYFNTVREIRDLLWQEDQLEPLIDEFAAFIAPLEAADAARWKGAPGDAGNYNHLGGAGTVSLANYVTDMKRFAFDGGASWPGGNDSVYPQANDSGLSGQQGRDAYLDWLGDSQGEGGRIPGTPTIAYTGAAGFPTNGLVFQSSAFADPQGAGTFGAMEWRIAEVTDPTAPAFDPTERFKLEIESDWESGELPTFSPTATIPTVAVRSGRSYRARVRHRDDTGRWGHWSAPVEFTATLPDISDYLSGLVVTEVMYHPTNPSAAEIAAGFDDDDFFEFVEIKNVGNATLDLTDLRFTKGVDFDFLGAAITSLAPGEFALVVNDVAAFEMRYGAGLPVAGAWQSGDRLDNGGEQLKLSFEAGDAIRDFIYDDVAPWPTEADGAGVSLTLIDPELVPDHALASSWRGSFASGGSPGADDLGLGYVAWRDSVFGPGEPAGSGHLDDPDGDGIPNIIEFALGGDPLDRNSRPAPTAGVTSGPGGDFLTISYDRRVGVIGLELVIEFSDELEMWEDAMVSPLGSPIDNGDGTQELVFASTIPLADVPRQFLRLRLELAGG